MRTRHTVSAEACSPDPDRAGPDAPTRLPDWVVHLIALVIRFMLERNLFGRSRRARLPSWWHDRPDLPPCSAMALAASIRGAFGNAIAWSCLRRGIGPGHEDWPELSRAIVAFGGSVKGFRPGLPACGLQWWENPELLPGATGDIRPTPAATVMARLLSRLAVTEAPPPALAVVPAQAEPAEAPALVRAILARASTGPPTGPPAGPTAPAGSTGNSVATYQRGCGVAGPAILIRTAATPNGIACQAAALQRQDPSAKTNASLVRPVRRAAAQEGLTRIRRRMTQIHADGTVAGMRDPAHRAA